MVSKVYMSAVLSARYSCCVVRWDDIKAHFCCVNFSCINALSDAAMA